MAEARASGVVGNMATINWILMAWHVCQSYSGPELIAGLRQSVFVRVNDHPSSRLSFSLAQKPIRVTPRESAVNRSVIEDIARHWHL